MIRTDENGGKSLKEIRAVEKKAKDAEVKEQCERLAFERYGEETVKQWSNKYKGLFYLPVWSEEDEAAIEKMAVLKPVDRHILSFASTKIEDEGLYTFLEAVLRECWVDGDKEILDNDEYFIPAAQSLNKIVQGKKTALVKR
jgi:hypothetical protein